MIWLVLAACGGGADVDGDGVTVAGGDCDDLDPTIAPGADEWCDGVDQDCDGVADNDALDMVTFWPDADGDGYGDPDGAVQACDASGLDGDMVGNGDDCDDSDAKVNPDADDGPKEDRNCDGKVGTDLDGHWTGDCDLTTAYATSATLTLDLTDKSGTLTGTGDFVISNNYGGDFDETGPVTGTRDPDDQVDLSIASQYGSIPFSGEVDHGKLVLESTTVSGTVCTLSR